MYRIIVLMTFLALVFSQFVVARAIDFEITMATALGGLAMITAWFQRPLLLMRPSIWGLLLLLLLHGILVADNSSDIVDALRTTSLIAIGLGVANSLLGSHWSRNWLWAAVGQGVFLFLALLAIWTGLQAWGSSLVPPDYLYNPWGPRQWHGGFDTSLRYSRSRATGWFLEPSHAGMLASLAGVTSIALLKRRWQRLASLAFTGSSVVAAGSALGYGMFLTLTIPVAFLSVPKGTARAALASLAFALAPVVLTYELLPRAREFAVRGSSGNFRFVQPAEAVPHFLAAFPWGVGIGGHYRIAHDLGFTQIGATGEETFGLDNLYYQLLFGVGVLTPLVLVLLILALLKTKAWHSGTRIQRLLAFLLVAEMFAATGATFNAEMMLPLTVAVGSVLRNPEPPLSP